MYFDQIQHQVNLERLERYEALKREISAAQPENYLYQFKLAHIHMVRMEQDIKSLEFQCKEYAKFFEQLGKLIPKQPNDFTPLI